MAQKQSRFLQNQKKALGIGIALIMGVLLYLSTILVSETPLIDGFQEGEHYFLLENPRRIRGDKVEVMEFFSYGCIHCYNLDDDLESWVDSRLDNVSFVRTPAVANELWRVFGRAYYSMEIHGLLKTEHQRVFREIHEVRRNINSAEKFAALLMPEDTETFIKTFNSLPVTQKLERGDKLARRFNIASVPNIVVNGKYLVRATPSVGLSRMLDVVDHLIALEQKPNVTSN